LVHADWYVAIFRFFTSNACRDKKKSRNGNFDKLDRICQCEICHWETSSKIMSF